MIKLNIFASLILMFLFILVIPITQGVILSPSATGSNSETFLSNYKNLTENFFKPSFNVTQQFASPTFGGIMWVPWHDSSSACAITNLKDYGVVTVPNLTYNVMVTDEQSEICRILSLGTNESRFDGCYNTLLAIKSFTAGNLSTWISYRSGTSTYSLSGTNDTASDADARNILSLYYASNNTAFSTGNRTKYLDLANGMSQDFVTYNIKNQCLNSSVSNRKICYWLAGGKDVHANFASSPYVWTGYFPDAIKWALVAYSKTGNATYLNISQDFAEQYLMSTNYTGGTTATSFKVSPFNLNWNVTGAYPIATNFSGNNQYHWIPTNPAWDDSDAPRALQFCDSLRYVNISNISMTGNAWQNVSDYCKAWNATTTWTSTTSTIQYYRNGTNAVSPATGFYQNGLGGFLQTFYGTNYLSAKLIEALSHYSWGSGFTYDSASCYGVYRGVRPANLLFSSIGLDEVVLNGVSGGGDVGNLLLSSVNTIAIYLVSPTNGSTTNETSVNLSIIVVNNNVSSSQQVTTDPTPYMYANYSFDSSTEGWSVTGNLVSGGDGYLNITGNTFSPSLNLTRFESYNITYKFSIGTSVAQMKFYPLTATNSFGSNNRFYLENSTACGFVVKHEPTFQQVGTTIGCNPNVTRIINVFRTCRQMRAYFSWTNGTASGSAQGAMQNFDSAQNTSVNQNGTGIETSGTFIGERHIYNVDLINVGPNATSTVTTLHNSTMNVTFYNSTNGIVAQFNNTANGSSLSTILTGLSNGAQRYYFRAVSQDNDVTSDNMTFTTNYTAIISSLILRLKFNENNGTIVYDISGNGTNGQINSGTYANDNRIRTLVNNVDYTYTRSSGLLSLIAGNAYNWVMVSYSGSNANISAFSATMTGILNDITGLVSNFFSLFPVIGTILAVVILIGGIVLLVLFVNKMRASGTSRSSGFQG